MSSIDPISQPSVSAHGADAVIEAASKKAEELGLAATISVVDSNGNLKAFSRMDGAVLLGIEFSRRKAYTSLAFGGADTGQLFDFVVTIPALANALPSHPGIALAGGGVALVQGGQVVGAVGVSAGTVEQDQEIALAGAASLQA